MPKYRSRHRPLRPVDRMGNDTRSIDPPFYDTAGHPGHFDTYLSAPFKRYGPGLKADATTGNNGRLYISSPIYSSGSRTGHGGTDIVARGGVPLFAQANGTVTVATKSDFPTNEKLRMWVWPTDYVRPGKASDDQPGGVGQSTQQAAHERWMTTVSPDAHPYDYASGLTGEERLRLHNVEVDKVRTQGYAIPNSCGNHVIIEYDPNPAGVIYKVSYCHMRDGRYTPGGLEVAKDQRVTRGQLIGYVGGNPSEIGAGNSTGTHLHMTMRKRNPGDTGWTRIDPVSHVDWFPFAMGYREWSGANGSNRIARPAGYSDSLALAEVSDLTTPRQAEVQLASHNRARVGENLSAQPGRTPPPVSPFPQPQILTAGVGGGRAGVIIALAFLPILLGPTSIMRGLNKERFGEDER